MGLFDIIGPIMVGPSSSHTAGAVRIGYVTRQLMGEDIAAAEINLYGSFLATGKGHGTDKALVAGLMGMKEDDYRIPQSLDIAAERGIQIEFGEALLKDAHPNSVQIKALGVKGKKRTIVASSIGGGSIKICRIDDIETNFTGEYPTLIARIIDKPGMALKVVEKLDELEINIANLNLYKDTRAKGTAIMIIECDDAVPSEIVEEIKTWNDIGRVIYLYKEEMKLNPVTVEKLKEYKKKKKQEG
jgi:L-serine dehydratase